MSRFLVDPPQDGVEDGVLQVADDVGEEPLAEHVHGALQQVLPLEGVGGRRSLRPRLSEESESRTFHLSKPASLAHPRSPGCQARA